MRMTPLLKYTFGRLGLFLVAFLLLWPVPGPSLLVKLLVALLVSFTLSWFVLRRWRQELATDLAGRVERRRVERERLRSALAGEDATPAGNGDRAATTPAGDGDRAEAAPAGDGAGPPNRDEPA